MGVQHIIRLFPLTCTEHSTSCRLLPPKPHPPHPHPTKQELRSHLAAAVQDLARMAKFQREMGGCLDMMRLLLQRMAAGSGEEVEWEEAGGSRAAAATAAAAVGL